MKKLKPSPKIFKMPLKTFLEKAKWKMDFTVLKLSRKFSKLYVSEEGQVENGFHRQQKESRERSSRFFKTTKLKLWTDLFINAMLFSWGFCKFLEAGS
jgi:hypothetical protein